MPSLESFCLGFFLSTLSRPILKIRTKGGNRENAVQSTLCKWCECKLLFCAGALTGDFSSELLLEAEELLLESDEPLLLDEDELESKII